MNLQWTLVISGVLLMSIGVSLFTRRRMFKSPVATERDLLNLDNVIHQGH